MISQIRPALVTLALFTAITGIGYPLLVTGIAQAAFPSQANGSILDRGGKPNGSSLVGEPFSDPKYFWGRGSAATPPYNGRASSGSNLGPTNPVLVDAVKSRIKALKDADPENRSPIPVDLVTSSASGLDPHISPAAADYQVSRVARARGIDQEIVRAFVIAHTEGRQLGLLGEPRVNVLELNLALDARH
jgi:K+-transporting ATPase ATPase C chain